MNRLQYETSPYLLQHMNNPVDWYPWGEEAFTKAETEDKPVFLSIGYSTCHWCHVMAHESFEDAEAAHLLNRYFVPVKVDKEERPDIDSVYMRVCMALTGAGGWPTTIVMDHTGKPFFAGTCFPKRGHYGLPGLIDLLNTIRLSWDTNRKELLDSAGKIMAHVDSESKTKTAPAEPDSLIRRGIAYFKSAFDGRYGGFGRAPEIPSPHNLLFLMDVYEKLHHRDSLAMAETTLLAMAKGGIFDHIGFGFARYSTDEKWLAPHFEKMLYDNALLIMAYTKAYEITQNPIYRNVAEKTILYIRREMTHPEGGFYSAQDADSDGVEGKYYLLTPAEAISVLGEQDGQAFCGLYDITEAGNFEGKNIPNQCRLPAPDDSLSPLLPKLYEYRKTRTRLHTDDKILTAWNGMMIAALADASAVFGEEAYLTLATRAAHFLEGHLCDRDRVFTSWRDEKRTTAGFLDDYAFYIYALLRLYRATLEPDFLERAQTLTQTAVADFFDTQNGGFYLTSRSGEPLIARPKETYDSATPSGNAMMMLNLTILNLLTGGYDHIANRQMDFMTAAATEMPAGHAFFLYGLLEKDFPGRKIVAVTADPDERPQIARNLKGRAWGVILDRPTKEYPLKNGQTTYYVCDGNACHPAQNELTL